MVLTDKQRDDLHAGIYEYFLSRGDAYASVAEALAAVDPSVVTRHEGSNSSKTPLLEKKWTAIPRLQKKVLELEKQVAQSAKVHAHRPDDSGKRRLLPREPCIHTLNGHSAVVTSVALHPVYTVVVSGSEDGTLKVWDHESGDYIRTLKGHTNTVQSVTFTPSGSHLASCSTDLSIKVWDFATYACVRTLRGHDHTISSVRFLPVLEPVSNNKATFDTTAAGCQFLLSASRDATVKVWDMETGFCEATLTEHSDWVRCLAVRASDGARWASAGNDTTIVVYQQLKKWIELRGHDQVVEAIAFVSEEPRVVGTRETKQQTLQRDYLASGSRDRTVRLWKVSEGTCLLVLKAHDNWVRSVAIHPNGQYIVSSADDKTIRVFDIKAARCLRTLEKAHDHFVTSLDIHFSLPVLVSGSVDQSVRCWPLD